MEPTPTSDPARLSRGLARFWPTHGMPTPPPREPGDDDQDADHGSAERHAGADGAPDADRRTAADDSAPADRRADGDGTSGGDSRAAADSTTGTAPRSGPPHAAGPPQATGPLPGTTSGAALPGLTVATQPMSVEARPNTVNGASGRAWAAVPAGPAAPPARPVSPAAAAPGSASRMPGGIHPVSPGAAPADGVEPADPNGRPADRPGPALRPMASPERGLPDLPSGSGYAALSPDSGYAAHRPYGPPAMPDASRERPAGAAGPGGQIGNDRGAAGPSDGPGVDPAAVTGTAAGDGTATRGTPAVSGTPAVGRTAAVSGTAAVGRTAVSGMAAVSGTGAVGGTAAAGGVAATPEDREQPAGARGDGARRLRPGDVTQTRITIWGDEATEQIRQEWHEVKAQFVDDPVTALNRAHDLLTEAIQQLTESLLAERDDLDPLRETSTPDTERMRVAMRGYREFLDRILAL